MRVFNSLFARLLLAQTSLVLVLGLVFGGLFYVERNIALASLYADQWAPHLKQLIQSSPSSSAPDGFLLRDARPPEARKTYGMAPRLIALRQALASRGVDVNEIWVELTGPKPVLWLSIANTQRKPLWVGLASQIIEPQWPTRLLLAFSLLMLILIAVSWTFAKRITRPLEQLHQRIQAQRAGSEASSPALPISLRQVTPEVRAIDEAYTDLLDRLKRHAQERSVMLAGVSHDLRTPLGRIRLAAELLPDHSDITPRKIAIVRYVNDADRLIESFLDLVRSGELSFNELVDLADTARRVVAGFDKPASALSMTAPESIWLEHANQLLVERMIANLIDNAFKHGRPPVHISLRREAAQIFIEIEDCGRGIPVERQGAMQEAFTRGDMGRTNSGSGLGLTIVRQIAGRMKGQLSFEHSSDKFVVRVCLQS